MKTKQKEYDLSWYEIVRYRGTIKAKSKAEAKKKFLGGDFDFMDAEEEDGDYEEGSLEVSECE